jgi:hypothetical protein
VAVAKVEKMVAERAVEEATAAAMEGGRAAGLMVAGRKRSSARMEAS